MVLISPTNHTLGRDMPFNYFIKIVKSEICAFLGIFWLTDSVLYNIKEPNLRI